METMFDETSQTSEKPNKACEEEVNNVQLKVRSNLFVEGLRLIIRHFFNSIGYNSLVSRIVRRGLLLRNYMKPIQKPSPLNIKKMCENNIKCLLNVNSSSLENTLPQSANRIMNASKFKFDVLKDRPIETERPKREKLTLRKRTCDKGLANVAALEKENISHHSSVNPVAKVPAKREREPPQDETQKRVTRSLTRENRDKQESVETETVSKEDVQKLKSNSRDISPIRPNPYTHINTFISGHIRKAKWPPRYRKSNERNEAVRLASADDYADEYLEDIIINTKIREATIVLEENFLNKFNPKVTYRFQIVTWMLSLQPILNLDENEMYLSVNLVDQVLARIRVPKNMYQLVAITCILLGNKFIGTDILPTKILLKICSNVYVEQQLLSMEKKLLRLLNFYISTVEPTLFINAYLKMLYNLGQDSCVFTTVYFMLKCSVVLEMYSSIPCSVLVAGCICLALKYFHEYLFERADKYFNEHQTPEEKQQCKALKLALTRNLVELESPAITQTIKNKFKNFIAENEN